MSVQKSTTKSTSPVRKALSVFRHKPYTVPATGNKYLTPDQKDSQRGGRARDDVGKLEPKKLAPIPITYRVHYLTTEYQANEALISIIDGVLGFDTEFTKRRPTIEEHFIINSFPNGGAARKTALLAIPKELRRILTSPNIAKVGVGLANDILALWDDLRVEPVNMVDTGLMARLSLVDEFPKIGFANLSMQVAVEHVLGYALNKEESESNWASKKLTDEQINYAGLDAVASLMLYDKLKVDLEAKTLAIGSPIPKGWYTYNTKHGDPIRIKKAQDGSDIGWKASDCNWWAAGKFQGYP
ncbi:ribonuclease H-like domain-containing protein [Mycena alexandri]|uniref:3'-5' exonuclease n=1 Tax=Mycena alexandri TaxID=1745969 RepID=A0AAD6SNE6_9AGAR|nr:ribonuclease H-like domain-containing protein [Mycena alexandri]